MHKFVFNVGLFLSLSACFARDSLIFLSIESIWNINLKGRWENQLNFDHFKFFPKLLPLKTGKIYILKTKKLVYTKVIKKIAKRYY